MFGELISCHLLSKEQSLTSQQTNQQTKTRQQNHLGFLSLKKYEQCLLAPYTLSSVKMLLEPPEQTKMIWSYDPVLTREICEHLIPINQVSKRGTMIHFLSLWAGTKGGMTLLEVLHTKHWQKAPASVRSPWEETKHLVGHKVSPSYGVNSCELLFLLKYHGS